MNLIEKPTCRLPCLWGIEPGVTTPEEALQFFQSFSWEIDQIGPLRFKGHWVSSYSISFEDENVLDGLRLDVQDGQIIQLLTQTYSRRSEYMLSNLLSEYGKPDRVYILTSSNPPVRPIPFYLIVFYESQRIIARYDYPAVLKGDTVETCQLTKGPMLLTWSSTDNWTESEITDLLGPGIEYVKPLEEVTDLSIDTFYEKFKTYSENNCIKSDVEYWN